MKILIYFINFVKTKQNQDEKQSIIFSELFPIIRKFSL